MFVLTSLKLDDEGLKLGSVPVVRHLLPDLLASIGCRNQSGVKILVGEPP